MKLDTEKLNETVQPLSKLGKLTKCLFHFRQFYLFADGADLMKLDPEKLNEFLSACEQNGKWSMNRFLIPTRLAFFSKISLFMKPIKKNRMSYSSYFSLIFT